MKVVSNVNVGAADIDMTTPSHVEGIREGNQPGGIKKMAGLKYRRKKLEGTAARSTGINPRARNPIDPRMPNISPS